MNSGGWSGRKATHRSSNTAAGCGVCSNCMIGFGCHWHAAKTCLGSLDLLQAVAQKRPASTRYFCSPVTALVPENSLNGQGDQASKKRQLERFRT